MKKLNIVGLDHDVRMTSWLLEVLRKKKETKSVDKLGVYEQDKTLAATLLLTTKTAQELSDWCHTVKIPKVYGGIGARLDAYDAESCFGDATQIQELNDLRELLENAKRKEKPNVRRNKKR